MIFSDFILVGEILKKVEVRKKELINNAQSYFKTKYNFVPDWDLGTEIATDQSIYNLYLRLDKIVGDVYD